MMGIILHRFSPEGEHLKALLEFRESLDRTAHERFREEMDSEEGAWDLLFELDQFLVHLMAPANVGEVRAIPASLHIEAIQFLIERDASNAYEQVDGFCEAVNPIHVNEGEREVSARILEECQPGDGGLEICEWISANIPEPVSILENCSSGI